MEFKGFKPVQITAHEDISGLVHVYVCDHCGQPLRDAASWCNSGAHVGPNSGERGKAISTVQLVRRLRDALAPASPLFNEEPG